MKKVFIDGSVGTTGLRIRERLSERKELQLLSLPEPLRKDPAARLDMIRSADVAFLCLPDDAAKEIIQLAGDCDTVIIDTSTVHRVHPDWTYGFPELPRQRERIIAAKRIANPGCHATGFIALVAPLRQAGLLSAEAKLHCFSLTGYSGGGKKMIAQYEAADRDPLLDAPRMYGLAQAHKHLPEMAALCGLAQPPVFCPVVGPFYAGMEVCVSLHRAEFGGSLSDLSAAYASCYQSSGLIRLREHGDEAGFLSAGAYAGRDDLEIALWGQEDRILLTARFDNLGKGASGAAIQNMNLALGFPETEGLSIG